MYINNDGIPLHLELEMPAQSGEKCPLVIVIHGFTGHMEEAHIRAVSRAMNEIGFATLRAEMYGHGGSGGTFREHTLYKWVTNALAVIDYARGLDFVSKLYLCGHSQGGLLVMLAGALRHDEIDGIIPLSPAWRIPEGARKGCVLGVSFDPDHIPEEVCFGDDGPLDGNYLRIAQTIHVEDAIDRYDGLVLIVHGDADESVPFRDAEDAAARYKNCELVRIPGDTHCFDYHCDQMTEAVQRWLRNRTQDRT